jgi:hypothetical protein
VGIQFMIKLIFNPAHPHLGRFAIEIPIDRR